MFAGNTSNFHGLGGRCAPGFQGSHSPPYTVNLAHINPLAYEF